MMYSEVPSGMDLSQEIASKDGPQSTTTETPENQDVPGKNQIPETTSDKEKVPVTEEAKGNEICLESVLDTNNADKSQEDTPEKYVSEEDKGQSRSDNGILLINELKIKLDVEVKEKKKLLKQIEHLQKRVKELDSKK